MRSYKLNIAGYKIGLTATAGCQDLVPAKKFHRNIIQDDNLDIMISIHPGAYKMHEKAERVFHAPYVEEINGIQIHNRTNFWSIWKYSSQLFIKTVFPLSDSEKNATLKFSLSTREWDLWIDCAEKEIDPFEYPLDGLILYYLTVIHGDIMIHASGINNAGHGYLFSGTSGKGKSTLAKIWANAGSNIIHDDRLIIRNHGKDYIMHNTPIYEYDFPKNSLLEKIFVIDHGTSNKLVPVKGASAVSLVMANCIQHNWGHDIIAKLLGSVSIMCSTIPVNRLYFRPDRTVIDHILEYE